MGRVIESTFRSLNNLLEHLHQSFFFYLLMQANRFVSIGTYLPSAMLVAVNFTLMAIALWVQSGRQSNCSPQDEIQPLMLIDDKEGKALAPVQIINVRERHLFLPLATVAGAQFLGVVPLYLFNHSTESMLPVIFYVFALMNCLVPFAVSMIITRYFQPTSQQYQLMKSFSLLLLGMFLSSLATLNFSLALLVGLLAAPLAYVRPLPGRPIVAALFNITLNFLAPTAVLFFGSFYWKIAVGEILKEAAFGWDVWGMNTQVVVWCVWWPAWLVGAILLLGKPVDKPLL